MDSGTSGFRRGIRSGTRSLGVPTLALPIDLPLSDTTGYLGVTTNKDNGTLYYVVTTSATPPTAAQVKAGQDDGGAAATFAGSQAISSAGAKTDTATGLTSNTAYYAYFMHEDASANQSSVASGGGFTTLTALTSDASFDTLVAAMTTPPSTLRKGYIAQCIQALYAGAAWAQLDTLWVIAAADSQAGYLNWIAPASFTLTENGTGTFTVDRGYAGNGTTGFLATGWDPGTNGVNYLQNDAHLGSYALTDTVGGIPEFGSVTGAPAQTVLRSQATGVNAATRVNHNTTGAASTPTGSMPQHIMGMRSVSTAHTIWRDGVLATTTSATSAAPNTVDFAIGSTASTFTTRQIAAAHIGGALTAPEGLALYNALHDYMVAVGADT